MRSGLYNDSMPDLADTDPQTAAARAALAAVADDEADNARLYARRMRNRTELAHLDDHDPTPLDEPL